MNKQSTRLRTGQSLGVLGVRPLGLEEVGGGARYVRQVVFVPEAGAAADRQHAQQLVRLQTQLAGHLQHLLYEVLAELDAVLVVLDDARHHALDVSVQTTGYCESVLDYHGHGMGGVY